jgi:hypothetical protein
MVMFEHSLDGFHSVRFGRKRIKPGGRPIRRNDAARTGCNPKFPFKPNQLLDSKTGFVTWKPNGPSRHVYDRGQHFPASKNEGILGITIRFCCRSRRHLLGCRRRCRFNWRFIPPQNGEANTQQDGEAPVQLPLRCEAGGVRQPYGLRLLSLSLFQFPPRKARHPFRSPPPPQGTQKCDLQNSE